MNNAKVPNVKVPNVKVPNVNVNGPHNELVNKIISKVLILLIFLGIVGLLYGVYKIAKAVGNKTHYKDSKESCGVDIECKSNMCKFGMCV